MTKYMDKLCPKLRNWMVFENINEAYKQIITDLKSAPLSANTRELNNYCFTIENIEDNIVSCIPISLSYLCGEMLWYAKASEDLMFLSKFESTGYNRISLDNYANSAYGHIVHKRFGFDQVEQVISILGNCSTSRRAIINFNVPDRHRGTILDEICTIALQFYIKNDELNCTAIMRSNDAFGCLPYDFAFFTELQKYIAYRLDRKCGTYTHFAVSFHYYTFKDEVFVYNESDKVIHFDYKLLLDKVDSIWNKVESIERVNDEVPQLFEKELILKFN